MCNPAGTLSDGEVLEAPGGAGRGADGRPDRREAEDGPPPLQSVLYTHVNSEVCTLNVITCLMIDHTLNHMVITTIQVVLMSYTFSIQTIS